MRRIRTIWTLALVVLIAGACQRRDFAERITDVNLILKVNTNIANAGDVPLPETMPSTSRLFCGLWVMTAAPTSNGTRPGS